MKNMLLIIGTAALCACAKPYPVYQTEIQTVRLPLSLLEPVAVPPFSGTSNEDLLLYTLMLEENLSLCNARLEAIKKAWNDI